MTRRLMCAVLRQEYVFGWFIIFDVGDSQWRSLIFDRLGVDLCQQQIENLYLVCVTAKVTIVAGVIWENIR